MKLTSNSFKDGDYLGSDHVLSADYGKPGYGGPCPPEGDHPHRYLFTVHAVALHQLPVVADTSAAVVGFHLHFATLAEASLMGLYKR